MPGLIRPARRSDDRGTVLMLMPAAALIMILLGAIAVDSALVFMHQREAYNAASDAANDAASVGFDLVHYRRTSQFRYDDTRATGAARRALAAADVDGLTLVAVTEAPGGGVTVSVQVQVRRIFRPATFGSRTELLDVTVTSAGSTG